MLTGKIPTEKQKNPRPYKKQTVNFHLQNQSKLK